MGLALVVTLAFCLWVALWSIGVGGFDALMLTAVIVLIAGTVKSLGKFLPGADRRGGSTGGW